LSRISPTPSLPLRNRAVFSRSSKKQWARLAAAEALLHEREQELATLGVERDRRRNQAARLARRARARDERLETPLRGQVEHLTGEVRAGNEEIGRLRHENTSGREDLVAAQAAVAERDRLVGELRGEVERLSAAARSHDQQLEHERTESREALRAAGASVTEREEEIERLGGDLERLTAATRGRDEEIDRLGRGLAESVRR